MTRNKTMLAAAALFAATLVLAVTPTGHAQEAKMLFKMMDAKTPLTEKQARVLERIKKSPATVEVKLFQLQEGMLADAAAPLLFTLGSELKLEIKGYTLTKDDGV